MNIFEPIDPGIVVSVPANSTWTGYDVFDLGVDPEAKIVTVQVVQPISTTVGTVGVASAGTARASAVYWWDTLQTGTYTVTMGIGIFNGLVFYMTTGMTGTEFRIIGQWGGDSVVMPSASMGGIPDDDPSGDDKGTWVPQDMKDITAWGGPAINPVYEDSGNIVALTCFLRAGSGATNTDVRGTASTWDKQSPADFSKCSSMIPIDADDTYESRVDGTIDKSGENYAQDGFIHPVGYIKGGAWNDGTGNFYKYVGILNPTDDGIFFETWNEVAYTSETAINAHAVYSRWQNLDVAAFATPLVGHRSVGGTRAAVPLRYGTRNWVNQFANLTFDGTDVLLEEQKQAVGDAYAYPFGYLEFVRRRRITIV